MSDVILDVPYYSEFDEIDGSTNHIDIFKRRSCGIVSIKMIMDYWAEQKKIKKVTLEDLIKLALHHKAYSLQWSGRKGRGWIHSGLVRTAQELGFCSWRRSWLIHGKDHTFFKREGISQRSWNKYYSQVLSEAGHVFMESINSGRPFVVSIEKEMAVKSSPHLIVVTGYREKKGNLEGIFINDPHNPKNGAKERPLHKNQFISWKDFDRIWRKRAIFIAH